MKIEEYKKIVKNPLRQRTVVFLIKDEHILLGMKKRGFGKGYWLGIGGKVESGETVEEAAKREVSEEINVDVSSLERVARLNFYFPHVEDESWNQQVHVFLAKEWTGDPQESEEIKPEWFDKNNIPYEAMWDDAHYWLPEIIAGKHIEADFVFNDKLKIVDQVISPAN